jgi:glycosyltransferase involved in cell wall biosynthesis
LRVLIDMSYASRAPRSGTAVYLAQLTAALRATGDAEVIEVVNERRRPPGGSGIDSLRNLASDSWWVNVELPRLARTHAADVIHHPLPDRSLRAGVPQVVTVHDLAFERVPELFDPRYRVYAHLNHRAATLAAGAVIAVSETTAADIRDLWGVAPSRIVVAHHGPGQPLPPRATAKPTHSSHFLYVGDAEPRKGVATLLAAYSRYRQSAEQALPLVIAGSATRPGPPPPGVRNETDVALERLAELYADAAALVHPSCYEGFGLTPLEAMSAGAPVIAADAPGVAEVCGDAARYIPVHNAVALASALQELAEQPQLRDELRQRGKRRAADFSWADSARAHLAAYSLAT